jgi:predicted CXXCH cytochrome family protein
MRRQHLTQLIGTFVMATALLGLPTVAFSQGVANSVHNLSYLTGPTGEICVVCHTPHDADTSVSASPLWNHEVTAVNPYTLYSSATLDALPGQPSGVSKLCLSCHDGTVALDNYGGTTTGTDFISTGLVGTDLSNDHPISFAYTNALATTDGGLFQPTIDTTSLGGTIDDDLLFATFLECASCHDVHDVANDPNLLVIPNDGSDLCLTCHNK